MDNNFLQNADTLIMERHGSIMHKFKTENERNIAFLKTMTAEMEMLKSLVSSDIWTRVERYIDLLNLHSIIVSKYAYICGIKDCASLVYYIDTYFINSDFDELIFD